MNKQRFNVLISRPYAQLESALNVLPTNRFYVCACPTIDIVPTEKDSTLEATFYNALAFDYVIFTSQYAVTETFELLRTLGIKSRDLHSLRICAVGPMVSQHLNKFGLIAHMIPEQYTAQSLADLFPSVRSRSKKVLFPRGNRSPEILADVLRKKGYEVTSPIVYRTELRDVLDTQARLLIDASEVDCFAFTSPSSVTALTSILEAAGTRHALTDTVISAIGPSTYKACNDAGWPVDILPSEYTVHGMARAIAHFYSRHLKYSRQTNY